MPFYDLRDFLEKLEKEGELVRISRPVELKYELSAICRHALDMGGLTNNKALLFERPGERNIPLVVNLLATRKRFAMALDTQLDQLHQKFIDAGNRPLPPKLIDDAPCQEEVLTGDEVDLFKFPVPTWFEHDPAPYITAPCHITRDMDTGRRNVAIYRAQVHDKNHLGLLCASYRHLGLQMAKAHRQNKPFPVAICLGADPCIWIAAQSPLPFGEDELSLAGALRNEPVEVVKCKTIDLEVPANTEIVIEGELLPGDTRDEGPFGEFTGYYGAEKAPRPVITVKAITHRSNPIYHAACQGRPPNETSITSLIPHEAEIMRTVHFPGLKTVYLSAGGVGFLALAAIHKLFEGHGKVMASAILATEPGRMLKTLILVDDDIDPQNPNLVDWALATRFQPNQDVIILKGIPGLSLDPVMSPAEKNNGTFLTSKLVIDATRPWGPEFPPEAKPSEEIMARVTANWSDYGLD
jgi:UbiD family decarboxylase